MKKFFRLAVVSSLLWAHAQASSAVLIVEGDDLERNRRLSGELAQYDGAGSSIGVAPEQSQLTDLTGNVNRLFITEPFQARTVSGMARDVTLDEAMQMVVPSDYQVVYRVSKESQKLPVSWRGGVEWPQIVKEIMNQARGYAFIDPSSKKVIISASASNDTWEVSTKDKTLRVSLTRWVSLAGWQLVWDIDRDFNVDASATINGSFKDAVTDLVTSLSSSDYPVRAVFYEKSKTLRIVKYTAGFRNQQ